MMHRMLEAGGRQWPLRYTVNSVCCLEERFQKALHSLLCTDAASVRALLWCGLIHHDAALTPEDAGRILDQVLQEGRSLVDVATLCADALADAGFFRPAEGR